MRTITELYQSRTEVSAKVKAALDAGATYWGAKGRKPVTLVLPILMITDKEQGNFAKEFYTTLTSKNIDDAVGVINCLLLPPVVINFFKGH